MDTGTRVPHSPLWEALRQSYGEADLKRRQSDLTANLNAKYSTIDSLSRSAKIQAVKDLSLNPYFFKDPHDGVSNNLWRWKQQAVRFQGNSPEEKDAIASKFYDEQLAAFKQQGAIGISKRQWKENAWTRAMDFDPAQNYRNPFLHGVISGVESAEARVGRAAETLYDIVGIPLRAWSEGISNPSQGVFAGWHNLAANIHNRPAGTSAIGTALAYGEEAPGLGRLAKFNKDAADYFSFWHDVTPNKTWYEGLTAGGVDFALQLPLYGAAGEAAKLGVGLVSSIGEGLPYIGNLTRTLAASKTGQFASKLLVQGTEGLIYGNATRDLEDKSNAWKDAVQFAVFGTVLNWAGKGVGKVKDFLPEGSAERAAAEAAEKKAALGANGKREATPEEILQQHRENIASTAAAGGMAAVHSVFEEALGHVRASEAGRTPEEWDTLKQQLIGEDPDRFKTTLAVTEMMRSWLKDRGISMKDLDEAFAKGDTSHYDAFTKFMNDQIDLATKEAPSHVPEITESQAMELAEKHIQSPEGQAEIKELVKQGMKPKDAVEQVRNRVIKTQGDFIRKAEESRTETGPENQAAKAAASPLPPGVKPLPPSLSRSKPKYGYGLGNNFDVQFEDPRDLAAYVITKSKAGKDSAAHEQFVEYYKEHHPNMTPESLKAHGDRIRAALKDQAKNYAGEPGEPLVLKLKSMSLKEPVTHEPLLRRVGRYIYDKAGKAVGYSMSVGFDWNIAKENASKARGWKKASAADNAFWKEFANFHDDADTDDPKGFVGDLKQYFNPVKSKGLQFETAGSSDSTNFLAFMYHFRDKLPEPVADKLQEILLDSKKMKEILNTRRVTEDQLEHFAQSMANHVEMFTRSKWFLEKKEKNIFRSTQPGIGEKTQWQRDLLEDMQKRELGAASSYFPGRSKAVAEARGAYRAALMLLHADETEAFNAKYPKDKQSEARLTATMERTKELARRAAQDRLSAKTLSNLMAEHNDLMERLGGRQGDSIKAILHAEERPGLSKDVVKEARAMLKIHEEYQRQYDAKRDDAMARKTEAFQRMLNAPHGSPERAQAEADYNKAWEDWQEAFTDRFEGTGKLTAYIHDLQDIIRRSEQSGAYYGRVSEDYAGRTTVWFSKELMRHFQVATDPRSFLRNETLLGRNLGTADLDIAIDTIKRSNILNQLSGIKYRDMLVNLLNSAKSKAGSQGVNIARLHGDSLKEVLARAKDTFHEEWTHGWQRSLLGSYVDDATFIQNHLDSAVVDRLHDIIPDGMRKHLDRNYPTAGKKLRVLEAGAKLISQHPSKFGMTKEEAADFLTEYCNALADKYGPEAFKHLTTAVGIAKEMKNAYAAFSK